MFKKYADKMNSGDFTINSNAFGFLKSNELIGDALSNAVANFFCILQAKQ